MNLFQTLQIEILIGLVILVGAMVTYIYAPKDEPTKPRIPPELLQGDLPPDDPFKSSDVMDKRLDDFGRFNTRYNEADGIIPGLRFFRRWFR
ncbi:MAG: hypothetical protein AAFN27_02620 [Pseudomonadota bacterium]